MKKIIPSFFLFFFILSPVFSAVLINDTEIERTLMELVTPLAKGAGIPDGRLKIHIISDNDFNAFVRGGEDVFIYTGLLTQIKSPLALQAVIAHELGHTLGGHMVQMSARMSAELKRGMVMQALGIGLMVAGGDPSLGMGVMAGSAGLAKQSMLSFTRDEERVADNLGIDLMIKSGLNPNGFVEVFQQMNQMMGSIESKIDPDRINHPLTSERLNNVKDRLNNMEKPKNLSSSDDKKTKDSYEFIRAKLIGYLGSANEIKGQYPNTNKSDSAIYARAIANLRWGDFKTAKTGVGTLINRHPDNPYFYELLGDIEYKSGNYDSSVSAFETSLKLSKNSPQIQTALAIVLSDRKKTGDIERAIELSKHAVLLQPSPLAFGILSRLYTGGKSDWAKAEYYSLINDKKNAKIYAKKAQRSLPKDSPEYIKSGDILR